MECRCLQNFQLYVLLVLNILLVIIGLTILGLSIFAYMEFELQSLMERAGILFEIHILICILMGVGATTVVIAIIGFYSISHESTCLIALCETVLTLLLCVEVTIGVLSILYQQNIDDKMTISIRNITSEWFEEFDDADAEVQRLVYRDIVQSTLECCGGDDPRDYGGSPLPASCCPLTTATGVCDPALAYTTGCNAKASETIEGGFRGFTVVILAIAAYEVVELVLTMIFYLTVVKRNSRSKYVTVPREWKNSGENTPASV